MIMMDRFLLFKHDYYYPEGGWYDLVDSFTSLKKAIDAGHKLEADYSGSEIHVVDLRECKIVYIATASFEESWLPDKERTT